MIKQIRFKFLGLVLVFIHFAAHAQLPYQESFRNSTAPGSVFGGVPVPAFLTAASDGNGGAAIDANGNGYLRLTDNSSDKKGYIYNSQSFPAKKGFHIEVEYFVYRGIGRADGICFFLFDAAAGTPSVPFQIGGFGGSLGYAPKLENGNPVRGMSRGYIGVGLDEYGNFSNNDEGRSGGDNGPVLKPGSVTLRGKGDATIPTTQYPFIASVQTLPTFGFDLTPANGNAVRITDPTDPDYRLAIVDMEPVITGGNVTGYRVRVDITRGGTPVQTTRVLDQVYNEAPPALMKYGISASTGFATNFHEIRNVRITKSDFTTVTPPVANADVYARCLGTLQSLDPLSNDTYTNDGAVFKTGTIDLDPSTPLVIDNTKTVANGTFTAQDDGTIIFTPLNSSVTGSATVSYTFQDNYSVVSNTQTITINNTVTPGIDAGTDQNQNAVFSATPNNSANLSATISPGTVGSWTQVSGPTTAVIATPNATATAVSGLAYGNYVFRYTGTLGVACPASDDISVYVNAIPVTQDDAVTTSVSTLIHIPVLNNDSDANGNNTINKSTVTIVSAPTHGTISIDPSTGVVDYRPADGFRNDYDSFSYNVKDDKGAVSNNSIVTIAVSIKPNGADDLMATTMNVPLSYNVKTNDGAQDVGTTTVKKTDPAHGTLTSFTTGGAVVYTPALNYHGTDIFTYALKNTFGLESDIITVNITVKPAGTDDIASTPTNVPVNIPVKTNDGGATGSSVIKKTDPAHGSVLVLGDGTVLYTPAADYQGADLFTYALRDAVALESDPITVSITVRPAGSDDAVTTNISTPVNILVKDNDVSKTGTTVLKKTDPGHGTAVLNGDGSFTYTPVTGYQGTDVFTYALRNSANIESDPITVTITIQPKLITAPDAATTDINTPVGITVKANDPGAAGATVIQQSAPAHGSIVVNPDGTITYTPATDYYGPDSFNYILQNAGSVQSDPTLVSVGVRPVGTGDVYTTALNTQISLTVKDNDLSKTGTTVIRQTNPAHGTATVNPDNSITFVPAADYYGTDSFTYFLRLAGNLDSSPIPVTVNIRPAGTNDVYTINMNATSNAPVKDNDLSKTGTTVIKQTDPLHGSVVVNPDNTVTYTPVANYSGVDNFTYLLRTADPLSSDAINVRFNIKPVGTNDAAAASINTPIVIAVKDNDAGKVGTTVIKKTDPAHGTAVVNTEGTVTFTPVTGYLGTDVFTYTLLTADGIESDPITVNILVAAKLPALPDIAATDINTPVIIPVKDNDPSSTGLTVIKQSNPSHGTVIVNSNGTVTYSPSADYYGPDSFNYILQSSTLQESDPTLVSVTVRPAGLNDSYTTTINTQIIASVKDNDPSKAGTSVVKKTEPLHGTATVNSDNTVTYLPSSGYYGTDNFTYVLRILGADSNPITVTIGIRPAGSGDTYTVPLNTTFNAPVKDNDLSANATSVIKQSEPLHGVATVNADNTITYTPATNYSGIDNMSYILRTADPLSSDVISVRFNVKPAGSDDAVVMNVNTVALIPVKDNDISKTGTTVLKKTDPSHGAAVLNADGSFTYTPVTGYLGTDAFRYSLLTADGIESDQVTVNISVVSKLPTLPDVASTTINTPIDIPVKNNDVNSTGLTVNIQSNPLHGSVSVNPDGTVKYTPVTDYYGIDNFNYTLKGPGTTESDPTPVTVSVRPAGTNDAYAVILNTPVTNSVKDNDVSKTGTTVVKQGDPVHGTAVVNADNTITYTPATNYSGTDVLTYILRTADPLSSDVITVRYTIKPSGTDDVVSASMNTPVIINEKDNDVSKTGTSVTKKSDPAHGTVTVNPDGTITYIPATNYHGKDSFTYTLKTADGVESDPINVTVNTKPAGTDDIAIGGPATPVIISVKDNDPGKTGSTVIKKTDPLHGVVTVNPDGTVTYVSLPGYVGPDVFTYTLRDADGLESNPITVAVNITLPPRIGLAKKLVDVKTVLNGSYELKYLFTLVNYSSVPLSNISLKDDLLSVFSGTEVTVVKVSHQGGLTLNSNFNGKSDIEMLDPTSSSLAGLGEEQVELTVNIKLLSRAGVFQNSAITEGTAPGGLKVTDQSTDGLKPDPTTAGDASPSFATLVDLKLNPIFIPEGFSPNGDGINDFFVIQNTLDKPVKLEVYNRWNNLIYKSLNYQNDWDGKTNQGIRIGEYAPSGTYWYIIEVDGQKFSKFITINR